MRSEITEVGEATFLANFTRPELIVPQLRDLDVAGIIEELSLRLRENRMVGDVLSFYHDAINREFLSDSSLPEGVAIPHARSAQVKRLALAIGRTRAPVVWGIKGSRPVEFVFLVAVPPTDASEYLSLLSSIASFCSERDMLTQLRAATDARKMFDLLKATQVRPA
jgi:PTS system fructose-specific IIC component